MRLSIRAAAAATAAATATTVALTAVPAQAATFTPQEGGCVITTIETKHEYLNELIGDKATHLAAGENALTTEQRDALYSAAVSRLAYLDTAVTAGQEGLVRAREESNGEEYVRIYDQLLHDESEQHTVRGIVRGLEQCAAGQSYETDTLSSGADLISSYGVGNLSSYITRDEVFPNGEATPDFAYGEFNRFGKILGAVIGAVTIAATVGIIAAAPALIKHLPPHIRSQVAALLPR